MPPRRFVTTVLAATAIAVALTTAPLSAAAMPARPVAAVPAGTDIALFVSDKTVVAGQSAELLDAVWSAPAAVRLDAVTITLDVAGLARVATVTYRPGGPCAAVTATRGRCTWPGPVTVGPASFRGFLNVAVEAAPVAEIGDHGTVTATLTAMEGGTAHTATATATVRVAEPVSLVAGDLVATSAAPGDAFEAPMTVRNDGAVTVHGVAVLFTNAWAFQPATMFRNCTYAGDELRSCTFDQQLAPGTTYRVTLPYRIRGDTYAPSDVHGWARWMTSDQAADLFAYLDRSGAPVGAGGEGGQLLLTAQAPAADTPTRDAPTRTVPQADVTPQDNGAHGLVRVTGSQGVDLAAIGGTRSGPVGTEVTAAVGARNRGPATLDFTQLGENVAETTLTVPSNTTVISVPDRCRRLVDGHVAPDRTPGPGGREYRCFSGYQLRAGTTDTFAFRLRIDAAAGVAGTVTVHDHCDCPAYEIDTDPVNNTASLVVSAHPPAGPSGNAGPDATGTDGGGTSDGEPNGELPITGPAGTTLAAAGMLLLILGGSATVLVRRRPHRFIA